MKHSTRCFVLTTSAAQFSPQHYYRACPLCGEYIFCWAMQNGCPCLIASNVAAPWQKAIWRNMQIASYQFETNNSVDIYAPNARKTSLLQHIGLLIKSKLRDMIFIWFSFHQMCLPWFVRIVLISLLGGGKNFTVHNTVVVFYLPVCNRWSWRKHCLLSWLFRWSQSQTHC